MIGEEPRVPPAFLLEDGRQYTAATNLLSESDSISLPATTPAVSVGPPHVSSRSRTGRFYSLSLSGTIRIIIEWNMVNFKEPRWELTHIILHFVLDREKILTCSPRPLMKRRLPQPNAASRILTVPSSRQRSGRRWRPFTSPWRKFSRDVQPISEYHDSSSANIS